MAHSNSTRWLPFLLFSGLTDLRLALQQRDVINGGAGKGASPPPQRIRMRHRVSTIHRGTRLPP